MLGALQASGIRFWTWWQTDWGISTFFFCLDFVVVVVLLPEVLRLRDRHQWRSLARTLLYEALTLLEGISSESGALHELFEPLLDEKRKSTPDDHPDQNTRDRLQEHSRQLRLVIEDFEALFSLSGLATKSYPKYSILLTEVIRSILECKRQLRNMEEAKEWYWLWAWWLVFRNEVRGQLDTRSKISLAVGNLSRQRSN
jgi:hypothetical protein